MKKYLKNKSIQKKKISHKKFNKKSKITTKNKNKLLIVSNPFNKKGGTNTYHNFNSVDFLSPGSKMGI